MKIYNNDNNNNNNSNNNNNNQGVMSSPARGVPAFT